MKQVSCVFEPFFVSIDLPVEFDFYIFSYFFKKIKTECILYNTWKLRKSVEGSAKGKSEAAPELFSFTSSWYEERILKSD